MTFKYCPNYASVLTSSPQTDDDEAVVYRARCKQWSCEYCAEINKKVWRARIMLEVGETRDVWFFWTLTLLGHDHGKGTAHSLQQWRNSWDKLMKRVKRDLGKMRYIRIFETHDDGTLHVHMLCDKTYDDVKKVKEADGRYNYRTAKLKAHLTALGLGWRHDVRPIVTSSFDDDGNARNVSAYVTKYMTKDLQSTVRSEL